MQRRGEEKGDSVGDRVVGYCTGARDKEKRTFIKVSIAQVCFETGVRFY
jgi:hypothetical protein